MARSVQKTKVWAVKCPKCGDMLYSRAQQDTRTCSCQDVNISGPNELLRVGFKVSQPIRFEIEVEASSNDLFLDWRSRANKFGLIKAVVPEVTVETVPMKESATSKPVEPPLVVVPPAKQDATSTTSSADQNRSNPAGSGSSRRRRRGFQDG